MRILWFTHLPADAVNRHFGRPTIGTGFWIHSLVQPLVDSGRVELAIATATAGDPAFHFREGAVEYFNIPQHKLLEIYNLLPRWRQSRYLQRAAQIVESWKPDLIHVHGTERFFGLVRARGLTQIPTIVSIQGVLAHLAPHMWGEMKFEDVVRNTTLWEIVRNATVFAEAGKLRRQSFLEQEILRGAHAAIGRTAWDHAHVHQANPALQYFHVDEMMRDPFMSAQAWSLSSARRFTLLTTSSASPNKGVPLLLRAVQTLRKWGYPVRLQIAGMSAAARNRSPERYTLKLICELRIQDSVDLLGWRNAESLVQDQLAAHCFVTPSYSENGCNALSEAQLVGMPCVATHTGGMTTTIEDGRSGLLYSLGDDAMLARQIERVLTDDDLASSLGAQARLLARMRHDRTTIVQSLIGAYERTIQASLSIDSAKAIER